MKLLLDTHAVLWWQADDRRLPPAARLHALPTHHADPFDRMLVAQAIMEGATLVTRDSALGAYGVPVLW